MALSLRQINYFIATAEAGKLSLAASQLGVSQSAVTEAIKALEHETGVELLRRHAKGIELTFEGNQFLRHARAVAAAVVVVEAAPRSGSLVTARLALDLGREVLAVPGRVTDELAVGTNAPDEQSIRSTPCAASALASSTDWSRSQPPAAQSVAEMRSHSGNASPITCRTRWQTSCTSRSRFSRLPPYASRRLFDSGERNSCNR